MRLKRTNNNGEFRISDKGKEVILSGWVHRRRDHGGVIFVDLRDRWGLTQVVFNPEHNLESHAIAESIRPEWVISVHGVIRPRMEGMANQKLATGEIEFRAILYQTDKEKLLFTQEELEELVLELTGNVTRIEFE